MNRIKIILTSNRTLHEMLIGTSVSNILILIIGLIFCEDKLNAAIGVLAGFLVAVFYLCHMAVTIDDTLYLDEKSASSQTIKHMAIRYVFVCAVVAIVAYFEIGNPVLCIFSCLTVKLGAYLQPVVHKILFRSEDKDLEEEV